MKPVFECRVCGVCCRGDGGIFIRTKDAAGPAALLGLDVETFIRTYTEPRHGLLALKTDDEGFCLFHDKENHFCRIHPVKPRMCRDWPFFYGPLYHREGFEVAKNNCPGIRADATWEEFKAWHEKHVGRRPPRSYLFDDWEEDIG